MTRNLLIRVYPFSIFSKGAENRYTLLEEILRKYVYQFSDFSDKILRRTKEYGLLKYFEF